MRSICLYFQVHQPYRLRTYRFFNIGDDHYYYDDFQNRHIIKRVTEKCYLPANKMILDLIKEYGNAFRVSFSISGTAIEQFEQYSPEVLESFRQLAKTGNVEFLAETYSHSLTSLRNKDVFFQEIDLHEKAIQKHFGQKPVTFRNTELIYSDGIGEMVAEKGFSMMITEGAKNILGWKSPNYLYCNAVNPKLKLLLRNFRLSDDLAFRFSDQSWPEWPLTAEKFVGWLNAIDPKEEVVNVFIDYETIGERQWKETGIFDFFKSLPGKVFSQSDFIFRTPSELNDKLQPIASLHVPFTISWADEERDLTSWLGNELQDEAFNKLFMTWEKVKESVDPSILSDWSRLQTSDHFYYMCTKWFSDGAIHKYFNPYSSPYEAFINYMNVLSDFMIRLDEQKPMIEEEATGKKEAGINDVVAESSIRKRKAPAVRTGKLKVEEVIVEVKRKRGRPPKTKPVELKEVKPQVVNEKPVREKKKMKENRVKEKPVKGRVIKEKVSENKNEEPPFKVLDFDQLINISDSKVKKMIKDLPIETVSYAMKGADKGIIEKIEKNLGKRALKTFQELLGGIKSITTSEAKKYRKEIIKHIKS
jgi:alpha-amylase